jgi:hypothetical protein
MIQTFIHVRAHFLSFLLFFFFSLLLSELPKFRPSEVSALDSPSKSKGSSGGKANGNHKSAVKASSSSGKKGGARKLWSDEEILNLHKGMKKYGRNWATVSLFFWKPIQPANYCDDFNIDCLFVCLVGCVGFFRYWRIMNSRVAPMWTSKISSETFRRRSKAAMRRGTRTNHNEE